MAKESSFDVVSTIDMQEVNNAFQQAKKELIDELGDVSYVNSAILEDRAGKHLIQLKNELIHLF